MNATPTAAPRTYRTEFPDFDPATMPAIPASWTDTSWRNDTCPSFECGAYRIFVDHANPDEREIADAPRYSVHLSESDCPALLAIDDWKVLLAWFVARGVPVFERAQWEDNKLLNKGDLPLWSGKGEPPAVDTDVPVGRGLTLRVESYTIMDGWLMILGVRSDGRRGNLAGTEIVWPKAQGGSEK